jgi:hypothetical protein
MVGDSPNLSIIEAQTLEDLLADYQDVFETGSGNRGRREKAYHRIGYRRCPAPSPAATQTPASEGSPGK